MGGNIFTLAKPKYSESCLKSEVMISGCPTGYLAYLLILGYRL